ncbi:MAG: AAA family ATPase [Saprospiraceae bacterium]
MYKLLLESEALKMIPLPEYRRELYHQLPWDNSCTAVLGPRGVGKTTLLLQRLQELALPVEEAMYADLGDLYFAENRLYDFARSYADQGGKYLFLDEVHRYPFGSWATELKLIYDRLRTKLTVVFTGSSVLKILNEQADLSRRVLSYRLAGLSFREYLLLRHEITLPPITLSLLLEKRQDYLALHAAEIARITTRQFEEYLVAGYYPYFLESALGYINRVNSSIQLVLQSDIPHPPEGLAANVGKLTRLLAAIADSAPFKPNLSKLAERIGMSRNNLLDYLTALERANLITLIRAEARGVAALGKPDKIFLDNTNLIYALSPQRTEIGTVRETFFLNQLRQLTFRPELVPPVIMLPKDGDFIWSYQDRRTVFEVGGPNKKAKQLRNEAASYLVIDQLQTATAKRIPLWMFGLLY